MCPVLIPLMCCWGRGDCFENGQIVGLVCSHGQGLCCCSSRECTPAKSPKEHNPAPGQLASRVSKFTIQVCPPQINPPPRATITEELAPDTKAAGTSTQPNRRLWYSLHGILTYLSLENKKLPSTKKEEEEAPKGQS